jgi:plastocyanin
VKPRAAISAGLAFAVFAAASITAAPDATGSIKGRIRLSGPDPGNRVIRMGMDPMCAKMWAGKKPGPVDEVVVTSTDGGLMNAFVKLEGSFPGTPVPSQPVQLDQSGCFYKPRVVGARVGQILRVKNSDNLLHNVHSSSSKRNSFNAGQPQAGISSDFKLSDEEMLKIGCDVHRWMTAWVGVVDHPYFAVSDANGSFTIANVPAGKRTISVWHEKFGTLTKSVDVKAGVPTTVDFEYPPAKKS